MLLESIVLCTLSFLPTCIAVVQIRTMHFRATESDTIEKSAIAVVELVGKSCLRVSVERAKVRARLPNSILPSSVSDPSCDVFQFLSNVL